MLDPNIAAWIRQNAAAAVETARTKGTNLNFTMPTLVSVGAEIGEVQQWYAHAAAVGDPSRNDVVNRVSTQIAAYVGEVLVKEFGAEWCSQGNQIWIQAGSQQFFLFQSMLEDLTTGQVRLFVITSQITGKSFVQLMADYKPGQAVQKPTVNYDPAALAREMQEAAAIAVRDVKGLDFTPASLPALQAALVKLQGMIADSPGHKSAIMNASLKKFGAYLGEVLVRHQGALWAKGVEGFAPDMPIVCMTPVCVGPQLLVHAVLEKQTLLMSGKYRATTAMDFLDIAQRLFMDWLTELMGGDEQSVRAALSQDSEVAHQVYSYCLMALTTATDKWKTNLDFLPESLARMDRILGRLYELAQSATPGSGSTEKQRSTMGMVWGAYLGETIRRKLGGSWIAGANPGQFLLQLPQGETVSPVEDVNARITGGTDILTRYYGRLTAAAEPTVTPSAVAIPTAPLVPATNPISEEVAAAQSEAAAEAAPPPVADNAETEARMAQQEAIAHKAFAASEDAIAEIKKIPGMAGFTLDYSVFSLQLIDKALATIRGKMQQDRARLRQSEEEFEKAARPIAVKVGCYFCETVRRVNGGEWREQDDSFSLQNGPVLVDGATAVTTLLSGKPAQFGKAQSAPSISQYYLLVRPVIGENFTQLLCGMEENEPALHGVLLPHSRANVLLYGSLRSVLVHAYCNEGTLLQFDREGLQKAEQMLQKYSTALKAPKNESEQINSYEMTCWFGTFLGEVIRRQLGAQWTIESMPGQGQAIGMQLGEAKFWPLRKVQKRLERGWEENIVFYFSAIAKMAHEGPSALTAANSTQLQ